MAIEEAVGEEDEIHEFSSKPSFKKSQSHAPYLNSTVYSAASMDRKYSRRNRTSNNSSSGGGGGGGLQPLKRVNFQTENSKSNFTELAPAKQIVGNCNAINDDDSTQLPSLQMDHECSSLTGFDDDDELNSLLLNNDSSLSGELLSYLDNRLSRSSSVLDDHPTETEEIDLHPNGLGHSIENIAANVDHLAAHQLNHHFVRNHSQSMENALDSSQFEFESYNSAIDDYSSLGVSETPPPPTTGAATTTTTLSITPPADITNRNSTIPSESMNFLHSNGCNAIIPFLMDSDEGSITSGCETSSIITTAHMDELLKSEREIDAIQLSLSRLPKHNTVSRNLERVSENDNSNQHSKSDGNHADGDDEDEDDDDDDDRSNNDNHCNGNDNNNNNRNSNEEDSEFSDESGFDENNVGKSNNFRIHGDIKNLNCEKSSTDSTTAADANNNVKHTFSPSTTKTMGRLRINIPKNAKSIDI